MANRYIKTVFQIEGYKDYTDSVKSMNSEHKKLNSELDLTKAQYSTTANSMDALVAKQKNYADIVAALEKKQEAQTKGVALAHEAVEKYTKQLADLHSKHDQILVQYGELSDEYKDYGVAVKTTEEFLAKAQRTEDNLTTTLNKTSVELGKMSAEQAKNNDYLKEAAISADGTAKSIDQYGNEVKETVPEQQNLNQSLESLSRILIAAGIQKGFNELVDILKSTVAASMDFESAITGVFKTVEGTPEQLQRITDGIKQMSTEMPASANEIAGVAEAAGQLGIKTDDVLEFTRIMTDLGVTTNLSAEQAATSLAKFANITKMSADDYERLGSSIVALGNNYATTEADIVSMATRLASTGELVGLSEAQIMAVAAAMSSVGIEAEAGGSAISKVLKNIELSVATNSESLKDYASVAGVSAAEFSRAWGEDAVSALSMFIDGLNDTERNGKSAIEILDEMGITEVRMSNAILSLAASEGILNDTLATSNTAWEENTALANEAALRYGTLESKQQMFKNSVELLKVAIGDELNPTLKNMYDNGGDIVDTLTKWVQANEWVVPTITALTVGLGVLVGGIVVATGAVAAFNAVTAAAGPALPIIAIAACVTALISLQLAFNETSEAVEEMKDKTAKLADSTDKVISNAQKTRDTFNETSEAIKNESDETIKLVERLEELNGKTNRTNAENVELKNIVDQLNANLPTLKLRFDDVSRSVKGYTGNVYDLIEAKRQLMQYESAEASLISALNDRDAIKKQIDGVKTLRSETEKVIKDFENMNPNAAQDIGYYDIEGYDIYEQAKFSLKQLNEDYKDLIIQQNKSRAIIQESTAIIDIYVASVGDATKETENNTNATANNSKAVSANTKENETAKKTSDEYSKALKAETSELKNVESNLKLVETANKGQANTVDALNKKLDAQTEILNKQGKRIELVKEARDSELGTLNEYEQKVNELTATQEKANEEYEARAKLLGEDSIKTQEQKQKLDELNASLEESTKIRDEAKENYTAYNTELNNSTVAQIELGNEINTTKGYLEDAANSTDGVTAKLDENGNLIKEKAQSTSSAVSKAAKEAEKAAKESAKEQEKAIKEASGVIAEAIKDIESRADSLVKAYESVFDSAKNSFQGQLNLFKSTSLQAEDITTTMLNNMISHTGELTKYNADLTKALTAGFSEDFVAELSSGSEESKKALSGLLKEYDKMNNSLSADDAKAFVDDYNWAFAQTRKASESVAATVAEIKTGFSAQAAGILDEAKIFSEGLSGYTGEAFEELKGRIDTVMSEIAVTAKTKGSGSVKDLAAGIKEAEPKATGNIKDLAKNLDKAYAGTLKLDNSGTSVPKQGGINYVDGVVDGIVEATPKAVAAVENLADALPEAFNYQLEIHSPSKVMEDSGEEIPRGIAKGIENEMDEPVNAMYAMGNKIGESMGIILGNFVPSMDELKELGEIGTATFIDFWEAATGQNVSLDKFDQLFGDFKESGAADELMIFLLDKMQGASFDLENAVYEYEEFVDIVRGVKREIHSWTDQNGQVHQIGNMPGYKPERINGVPTPVIDEEYWAEYDRIVNLRFAEDRAREERERLANREAWEVRADDTREAYEKQAQLVADLEKQLHDQFLRMAESRSHDDNGVIQIAESSAAAYENLRNELALAQNVLTATTFDFERLNEAIENGTVESFTRLVGASEEADAVIINHAHNLQTVADTQERIAELQELISSRGYVPNDSKQEEELEELIASLARAEEQLRSTTEAVLELEESLNESLADAVEESSNVWGEAMINAIDPEEWARYVAEMTAKGIEVGIRDSTGQVISAVDYMTGAVKDALQTGLEVHSPSRFTEWIADMLTGGLENKLIKNTPRVIAAAEDMTSSLKKAFSTTAEGYYNDLIKGVDLNPPSIQAQVEQFAYLSSLPVPSLENIVNNSSVINNNQRTSSPTIHISQLPGESQYELARRAAREQERIFYGI